MPSRHTRPSWPKRMRSPTASRLAGRANARQRLSSRRLCRLKATTRAVSAAHALALQRRADHARVVEHQRIARAAAGRAGRGRARSSSSSSPAPAGEGRTTSRRAASRGVAGSSAMRSSGRSKSKGRCAWARLGEAVGQLIEGLRAFARVGNRRRRCCSRAQRVDRGLTESLHVGGHLQRLDLVGVLHRLAALDLVDVLHALDHLAPHRVLLVEEAWRRRSR